MSRGLRNFKGFKFKNNILAIVGLGIAAALNMFGLELLREVLGETFLFNFDARLGRRSWSSRRRDWSLLSVIVVAAIVALAYPISKRGIGSHVGKDKYTGDALVISSLIVGIVMAVIGVIVNPSGVQEILNI